MSIRIRLFLLILAAMLPALIVIAWNATNARDQAIMAAEQDARNLVRIAHRLQQTSIDSSLQILSNLSRMESVKVPANRNRCRELLAELLELHPTIYTNFGVAGLDGNVYCSALPHDEPVSISDRSYFRRALESGDFSIGNFQVGRITGVAAVNFGYPIRNDADEIIAVVYAAMNLSSFRDLIHGLELPDGSSMMIIDTDGTILAHSSRNSGVPRQSHHHLALLDAVIASDRETIGEHTGLDGIKRIFAYAPVMTASTGNVHVVVGIPKAGVVTAAEQALLRDMLIMFAVLVAISIIAWLGSEALIAGRLRTLSTAIRQLAAGRLETRSGLEHGRDEFGQLALHFDNMAHDLQKSNRALQTLSAVNKTLLRADDERSLLQSMCDIAVNVGSFSFAWVGFVAEDPAENLAENLAENDSNTIEIVAQAGYLDGIEAFRGAVGRITLQDGPHGNSLVARSIRAGSEFIVQDLDEDEGVSPWRKILRSEASGSAAAFPLRVSTKIIGAISIHASSKHAFDESQVRLLRETAGDLGFGIGILRAGVEHERMREAVDHLAFRDDITGLPNYGRLTRELAERLQDGSAERLGIVLLNINRFGEVNAALGNVQGDRFLVAIGRILQDNARPNEFVARMRGDEFAVLVPGMTAADAEMTADRVQQGLPSTLEMDGIAVDVNTTAGVAIAPDHAQEVSALIHCADAALRNARRMAIRHSVYSSELHTTSPESLALAGDLRKAREAGQLLLHYQPKCHFNAEGCAGVEALIRWKHPQRGLVSPAEFIPLAEQTGQIKEITEFVLDEALRQVAEWRSAGMDIGTAVNVSSRNLHDPELLRFIEGLLEKHDVPRGRLELEITESAIMQNVRVVRDLLHNLRDLGVILSIDDFGTGYSSLQYLQQLPVHNLKIDKSFVMRMLEDRDSETIVASTIRMAHDLGLKVIAEGVETQAAWDKLAELKCDTGQGYLIARPAPAEEFETWANERSKEWNSGNRE